VRIPCAITIIATFVTIADLYMKAYAPSLHQRLGIFVPLIAANCILLSRAETFASRNNIVKSVVDGLVMGMGFSAALIFIAMIREILGGNSLFGYTVIAGFHPIALFQTAPGGFFIVAALLGIVNYRRLKKTKRNS
jgi:electron transport complex protein RnfE